MKFEEQTTTISDFATLRIVGDEFDPATMKRVVHIRPTFAQKRGDRIASKHSDGCRIAKCGTWYFSTRHVVLSSELSAHLAYLERNVLHQSFDFIRLPSLFLHFYRESLNRPLLKLIREQSLTLTVTCYWLGTEGALRPRIPESFNSLMRAYGGHLELDFSVELPDGSSTRLET